MECKLKIWLDVCCSISPERQKKYILSYKLELFSEKRVEIWLYLCGGISPERPIQSLAAEWGHQSGHWKKILSSKA